MENDKIKAGSICPLNADTCEKDLCAWWVNGYTTEGISIECCSMVYLAMKNSEGQYRV